MVRILIDVISALITHWYESCHLILGTLDLFSKKGEFISPIESKDRNN